MEWKLGNSKQIITSLVLIAIIAVATQVKQVSNIHLVVTVLLAILFGYAAYAWNKGGTQNPLKPTNPSKAYLVAFVTNALGSFAWDWWISGIIWVYILCVYIAIQQPKQIKPSEKEKKDDE